MPVAMSPASAQPLFCLATLAIKESTPTHRISGYLFRWLNHFVQATQYDLNFECSTMASLKHVGLDVTHMMWVVREWRGGEHPPSVHSPIALRWQIPPVHHLLPVTLKSSTLLRRIW
jgi:hypothetical protein